MSWSQRTERPESLNSSECTVVRAKLAISIFAETCPLSRFRWPRRKHRPKRLVHPRAGIDTLTGEIRMNGLWWPMKAISYARHRFPSDVIRHAVWLYLRFTLSYRDVEDLLAERGLEVSNESIRRWVLKFGPAIARNLRSIRSRPHSQWHLDEMDPGG